MVKEMGLKYLVITSVNRDDLPDGGASHFRDCVNITRAACPDTQFEVLTPDFLNCQVEALTILHAALPLVFAHNVETVPSRYGQVRKGGDYERSLRLLKMAKEVLGDVVTKSSIMLGLGETEDEVMEVLGDLRAVNCDRLTIGQYLKPSKESAEVLDYITPEKFTEWQTRAYELGFSWVISAPFARSSYFAERKSTAP
jgi:lipoic acid synthetase